MRWGRDIIDSSFEILRYGPISPDIVFDIIVRIDGRFLDIGPGLFERIYEKAFESGAHTDILGSIHRDKQGLLPLLIFLDSLGIVLILSIILQKDSHKPICRIFDCLQGAHASTLFAGDRREEL